MTMSDDEPQSVDRVQATGSIGLVIVVAFVLVAAAVLLLFVNRDEADPYIIAVLAALAVIGVFALFSYASGIIEFVGRASRNDLTKALADGGNDGLCLVDSAGRVIYANRAYLELTGAEQPDDVRPVERLFTSDPTVADAIYRLAQAVQSGRAHSEEIRVPNADKRGARWFRLRARPLGNKGRHARIAAWTMADITRDREKQESTFQSLQHAIDFLDHAPAGFFSSDAKGRVSYLNTTLAGWLGYDIAEIGADGLKLTDLVQGTSAALLTNMAPAPGEVRTEILEVDLRKKDGASLPVRLLHRVAFASDGTAGASRTLVLSRAKTGDKPDALRAAEIRFARFFHNSPAAIATVDRAGRIVNSNAMFARLFGAPATEKGERQSLFSFIAAGERPKFETLLRGVVERRSVPDEIELALAEDGGFARFFVTPVEEDAVEAGEAAIVHAIDTTEERKLEQSFAQAQKMQAIGEFAGFIAHDFNNVLTTMIGNASLLLVKVRPTDPGFQELNQIRQYGTRAAALVRQLLAFARRETLVPEMLHVGDVISDLANGLMRRVATEKVKIETTYGRDLWPVKADINQFERVLINLAANARDAMPNGGALKIRTANVTPEESKKFNYDGMPAAEYVMIEVADTGMGIPPETIGKIFEPFFTTKDKNQGSGLGLAAVYGIVKQSGGFIYVTSAPGAGATFRIFLPRYIPTEQEALAARDAAQAKAAPPEAKPVNLTGRGTVLLVEDEDGVRRFANHALTMRGFTVLEAADGEQGLEIAKREDGNIDIIVSDVMMPVMDGPTMLKEMRKQGLKKTKVIFASGYSEGLADQLPGEHFTFLPKPFDLVQLVRAVKEELQQN
jgi:two-component system cell cycle sensor histidine kinase/response regulator CckA